VGAFFLKFPIAPSGETKHRIKKVERCKDGTDLLYHHAKNGGDPGTRAGCRRKSVMFFVCLSVCLFVTLWNDEVCDNGNAMKQFNFQNNSGVVAYRKVCSCVPMFKFSYRPPEFSREANFYEKLPYWEIFGAVRRHF